MDNTDAQHAAFQASPAYLDAFHDWLDELFERENHQSPRREAGALGKEQQP